ncbi:hypothetical protein V1477_008464 [Vespula maculifrons]|uniref:Uncharacterized protein n=1 Tax=Vespula maculifrons TaxID=7453 RepID=A0ABD2CDT1_VESMC
MLGPFYLFTNQPNEYDIFSSEFLYINNPSTRIMLRGNVVLFLSSKYYCSTNNTNCNILKEKKRKNKTEQFL